MTESVTRYPYGAPLYGLVMRRRRQSRTPIFDSVNSVHTGDLRPPALAPSFHHAHDSATRLQGQKLELCTLRPVLLSLQGLNPSLHFYACPVSLCPVLRHPIPCSPPFFTLLPCWLHHPRFVCIHRLLDRLLHHRCGNSRPLLRPIPGSSSEHSATATIPSLPSSQFDTSAVVVISLSESCRAFRAHSIAPFLGTLSG